MDNRRPDLDNTTLEELNNLKESILNQRRRQALKKEEVKKSPTFETLNDGSGNVFTTDIAICESLKSLGISFLLANVEMGEIVDRSATIRTRTIYIINGGDLSRVLELLSVTLSLDEKKILDWNSLVVASAKEIVIPEHIPDEDKPLYTDEEP